MKRFPSQFHTEFVSRLEASYQTVVGILINFVPGFFDSSKSFVFILEPLAFEPSFDDDRLDRGETWTVERLKTCLKTLQDNFTPRSMSQRVILLPIRPARSEVHDALVENVTIGQHLYMRASIQAFRAPQQLSSESH
jgi:hypothetical protein